MNRKMEQLEAEILTLKDRLMVAMLDRDSFEEELKEARNEAAAVRRAYLHEMNRADEAVSQLHEYDPEEAEKLIEQKYQERAPYFTAGKHTGTPRARLDADRAAKPKTEIVGHYPEGKRNFYHNAARLTYRDVEEPETKGE